MLSRLFAQKFIIIVLSISLIISSSMVCAFADDEVGVDDSASTSVVYTELPDSMLPVTVTDPEAIEADLQLRQTALDIANVMASASDSGTRAIDYPAYIYSILNACYDSGNQRLWVNDYSLNNKITTTNSYLNDIVLDLESTTYGIIPKLASMIQTQNSMYNRLDEISDYTSQISAVGGVSDTLYNIYTFLVGMMQNTSDEGYLETITNTLSNIRSLDLAPIKTGINSINTNLGTINTSIGSSNTYLNNLYTSNHNDLTNLFNRSTNMYQEQLTQTSKITDIFNRLGNMYQSLDSFKSQNHTDITSLQNDMNNINWIDWTSIQNSVYTDYNATIHANSPANYTSPLYFGVAVYQGGYTLIQLPIRSNSIAGSTYSIEFSRLYNGIQPDFYTWSDTQSTYILVGSIPYYANSTLYVKFTPSSTYYLRGSDVVCKRLDANSADAYKVNQLIAINHIDNDIHDMSDDIDKLRRMYASDDELTAKENQQQFEGQVLNDFTGSGSASASLGDVSAVKGVSTGVKSGLDSGYGVSSSMTVFGDASFWGWFSQENYNSLNNLYSPSGTREQLRKSGDDLPYYNQNLNEIMSGGGAYND